MALNPVNPLRMSVTPAATHICVLAGIILAGSPTRYGPPLDRRCHARSRIHDRETQYALLPLRTSPWMQLEAPSPFLPVQACLLHLHQTRRGPTTGNRRTSPVAAARALDSKVRHDRACANGIPGWRLRHAHAPPLPPKHRLIESPLQSDTALPVCGTVVSFSYQK